MKKFFAMAAIAFMTLFAVSCGSDDEENTKSFLGSKWLSSNPVSYMGMTGTFDLNMNVFSEKELELGLKMTFMGREENQLDTIAYTIDDNQNVTLIEEDGNQTMTYDKDADTYTMTVSDAEVLQILGADKITFSRVK